MIMRTLLCGSMSIPVASIGGSMGGACSAQAGGATLSGSVDGQALSATLSSAVEGRFMGLVGYVWCYFLSREASR
jgi:hypothetical protein